MITLNEKLICKFKNLSSGESEVILKSLYHFACTQSFASISDLESVTNVSKKILFRYLNSLKDKYQFGRPQDGGLPIDAKDLEDKYNKFLELGKTQNYVKTKRKSSKRIKDEEINKFILRPYFRELRKKGLTSINGKYRGICRNVIRKVKKEFPQLSNEDIKNIAIRGLNNPYLKKVGKTTNLKAVFFSGANLVEKYIQNKKSKRLIINHKKQKVNPKMFGYFVKKEDKYEHIPPKNENAPYYIIKKELENRMLHNKYNHKLDKYFDKEDLKDEYKWMIGEKGNNNKFVKEK